MPDYFNPPTPTYPRPHYSPVLDPFFAGMVYDLFTAETTTRGCDTPLDFGLAVVQDGTTFDKVALPSSTNSNFAGVVRHEHVDPIINGGQPGFPARYPVPVLRKGHIVVKIDTNVTNINPNDPVHVRHTDSGENKKGQFRNTAVTGETTEWVGAKWVRNVAVGCAVVGIDLPN